MANKAHSSGNGHQAKALLREMRELRQEIGNRRSKIEDAVALADQEIGLRDLGLGMDFLNSEPRISNSGVGAQLRPVSAPAPESVAFGFSPANAPAGRGAMSVQGELTSTYGVSGTPITSGFLTDLGEYNPELQGRTAVPIYEKMRRSDAQVRATLMACKLPILSAKWEVMPTDVVRGSDSVIRGPQTTNREARAKETAEFVRENLFGGLEFKTSTGGWCTQTWQSVISNALLMLDFGCAIHEDVWRIDGDRIRLRSLPSRLPLTFYRWHTEADGETLVALEQYGYRREQFLNALLPAEKIARFTYQQEGANFWGIALQRAMYPHWYVKSKLYRIDAIANERNALGIPVFRLAQGFAAEDKAAAYNFVTQLAAHEATGLVEPPGEPHTGLRVAGYQGSLRDIMPSIQHHNEMISRAALNTFIDLGQSAHGSRALGATATDFFMLGLQSVADQIAQDLTCSTIRRLVALNFGDNAPVPRLVPANVQARSISEITADLTALAQQGLVVSEKNIRRMIRERFALPEESQEGIVAVRGEAIQQGATSISGRGAGEIEE